MRILSVTVVSILLFLTAALPTLAQWMGGPRGHSSCRGGCMCRMMDVTSQPVDPASLPEPSSLGAQLLKNQCTQCHGLVAPGQHAVQDWPSVIDRMDRRMQMMSHGGMGMMRHDVQPLTPAEKQALLDYLQKHAFQAVAPEALSQAQGASAQAYIDACSRCHALPDPEARTSQEWKKVVERMESNMANQGLEPLAPEQRSEILAYLQSRPQ